MSSLFTTRGITSSADSKVVQRLRDHLVGKGRSPATVNKVWRTLRSFLRFACEELGEIERAMRDHESDFAEALQKGLRSMETGLFGLDPVEPPGDGGADAFRAAVAAVIDGELGRQAPSESLDDGCDGRTPPPEAVNAAGA